MDAPLKAAIAGSHRAFACYVFSGWTPDGLGPLEARLLRLTPPGEVPSCVLAAYAEALPSTIDERAVDDLRALLPRFFELIAGGDLPASAMVRGLTSADYRRHWPTDEAQAVDAFLAAFLDAATARTDDDAVAIRGLLAAIGAYGQEGEAPARAEPDAPQPQGEVSSTSSRARCWR